MNLVQELGWLTIFSGSHNKFTMGLAIIMLIFDTLLFLLLTYYVDSVLPTDSSPKKHPLFFLKVNISYILSNFIEFVQACGITYFDKGPTILDSNEDQTDSTLINENMEPENVGLDQADIVLQHMSKKWDRGGDLAVDNLNFRAYRGKVDDFLVT